MYPGNWYTKTCNGVWYDPSTIGVGGSPILKTGGGETPQPPCFSPRTPLRFLTYALL